MNIEQQKKLYEEGNHTAVCKHKDGSSCWNIMPECEFGGPNTLDYQLISTKHTHILEAYLEGCEIYWYNYVQEKYHKIDDFVSNYREDCANWQFVAIPKSLENCYCLVTKTHILQKSDLHCSNEYDNHDYIIWQDDGSIMYSNSKYDYKQIEYSVQLQKWVYCPKETKDGVKNDNTIDTCTIHTSVETIKTYAEESSTSIEQQNNFEEYGFTFKFKDEIDNLYKDSLNVIHARLVLDNEPIRWNYKGVCITHSSIYNLTPIVPEVTYPIFKRAKNDDIFKFTDSENMICVLSSTLKSIGASFKTNTFSHDVWENVSYDTERGLYHGQPVYFINQGRGRTIDIWDITKQYTSNFGRDANIEPVSLDTLKTLPFIWKQYKAFIKEN